ncbi:xanthine dehydrogenase family protein molybdopterin-binding subunit [Yoonia sp. 2307UL14-13]|uniref:xanthine dehydrogenase family protein molybdopterin-binding subunit n=1 Tax=Yoonia sp. 2307UL14-13 TaxID=3126506 RepID=UPI0030AEE276
MGAVKTIARRTFLIGSAAVMGGVAFGTYMVQRPYDNPLLSDLKEGEAAFNPYVKITGDQITLIVNHADKGQGVQSSQAMLIAEELDVDLDQVNLSFGHPAPAYYNTGFAAEAVPFMSFDKSFAAETMRDIAGGALKLMAVQGTGGSTSMPDQFVKLRTAGAVARETLKLAAAQESGVPVAELKTARGAVQLPDGTEIPYTDLAAAAVNIPPVEEVTLRDPGEWRLIGKKMRRTDVMAKSTGTQTYGIDLEVEGMVHAAVRTNPRQGGGIDSYRDLQVKQMRGVQDVLPVTNGVAVIADNTWRAMNAANALEIEWGPAPYPAEQAAHWEEVANSFTDERLDSEWRSDGDVATALQDADLIKAEYRAPYVAHAPLEPLNAIVRVDENGAEVWAGHQMPGFLLMEVAKIAGCDTDAVVFHNQMIGGSFGHRLEFDNIKLATEIAAQMPGTPVKLTYTREEDFAHDYPRQIGMSRSQGRVKGGKVDSWSLDIAMPSVMASQLSRIGQAAPGPDMQIVAGAWNMPYDIPNLRVRAYRVPELAPISSWRSVGASSAGFFAEGFLDELIHAAGVDPMEERLRLCNNDIHREVLEAVAEMSSWGSDLGPNRGRGVAIVESFGVPTAEVVEVTMTDRGIKLDNVYVAADVGQIVDPVNLESQLSGGAIWALGHAMNAEITYTDGMVEQTNYHAHEAMRIHQCPAVEVRALENGAEIKGAGEPGVPPAAPALANAIFAATGQRLREMPFNKFIDFA